MYKAYCEDAKVAYPYSQRAFKEELKNYFRDYKEREILADGTLDKPLTVVADAFSVQAIKMITLTGGHAVQKKSKR